MKNLFDLTGRAAIVTGAAGGIGADAVWAFLEQGAKVAALDVDSAKLDDLAQRAKEAGYDLFTCRCDVSDEESVNNAVSAVLKGLGRVDILLNNAGIAVGVEANTPMEVWDHAMGINIRGQWLMMRAVLPTMINQHYGKIVNISSVNAFSTFHNLPLQPYYASKAGVLGLTRGIASYYGKHGITCNAICPGLFITGMTRDTWSPEMKATYNMLVPLGRAGESGELNGAILFLSSEASSYVNGAQIVVDGGATCSSPL